MNTEETATPFRLSPMHKDGAPGQVIPYPSRESKVRQALTINPATASDLQSRAAAQTLAREALTAHQIAQPTHSNSAKIGNITRKRTGDEDTFSASRRRLRWRLDAFIA